MLKYVRTSCLAGELILCNYAITALGQGANASYSFLLPIWVKLGLGVIRAAQGMQKI